MSLFRLRGTSLNFDCTGSLPDKWGEKVVRVGNQCARPMPERNAALSIP
jgi:hypothetical protein